MWRYLLSINFRFKLRSSILVLLLFPFFPFRVVQHSEERKRRPTTQNFMSAEISRRNNAYEAREIAMAMTVPRSTARRT